VSSRSAKKGAPFLLDTHIWFWYLVGSDRLPNGLRSSIDDAAGDLWLSPISLWELGMSERTGRLRLDRDLRGWVEEAQRAFPVTEAPLNTEVALVSHEVQLPHRDPADRFLAATALVYGLTLLTVDRRLTEARWLPTRSG
jgi:PIN domain nuclease of toxin-antitoxin system